MTSHESNTIHRTRGTGPRRLDRLALACLLACAGLLTIAAPALAQDAPKEPSYRCSDPSLVYYGNPRLFKKPAVLSADRVYRAIPEYQEILAKNLTDRDVRYHFLMKKASDKFMRAVASVAREGGYDLVGCAGCIVPETAESPAPPDVTDTAISRLPA